MVIYPVICFAFGIFVAYGNQATLDFYRSTSVTQNTVSLLLVQIVRGGLWARFALLLSNILRRCEHVVVAVTGGFTYQKNAFMALLS